MKVIKKGKSASGWSKRFKCHECKSTLEVKKRDLKVINTAVAYGGEIWEPKVGFWCSVCKSWVFTGDGKIPSGIEDDLLEKASKRYRSS